MDRTNSSGKTLIYGLLITVILIWAVAWPLSKIGLMDMPPMWFAAARLWIGFFCLFIILLVQKKIKFPKRADIPFIASIGLLQMACFLILLNGGLLFVDAGRSAILVYSTPFFITPIAVMFFNEKLTRYKVIGLLFGLFGILLLFNPHSFNWKDAHTVMGNGMLLGAAACWAATMLHIRYGTWHSPSLQLVPWQLLIASIFVLGVCFILDPHPVINWNSRLVYMALYNGVLATGFAYAAIIYVSQRLPVITTSILMLSVPVIGLLCSAWWLGENLAPSKVAAMLFIIAGLATISLEAKAESKV